MQPTTEVRWWWPGRSSLAVDRWFAGLEGVVRDEERVDRYLAAIGDADTGVKVRAGECLDVKTLTRRTADVPLGDGAVGTVESWSKWSFRLAPGAPTGDDLDGDPATWVAVRKRRWLLDVEGCEVELAGTTAGAQAWWTLALEASGHGDVALARLVDTARWLLSTSPPAALALDAERSRGYAEHLARLRRR